MIGLFAHGDEGRGAARELAGRFGPESVVVDGPLRGAVSRVWDRLDAAVVVASTDAAVRAVAPLLRDPFTDPAVVSVDGQRRFAVAVAGGRDRAGALAEAVAEVLGCTPVVAPTGSGDAAGTVLDDVTESVDATVDGDLAGCAAAVLRGDPVKIVNPLGFALPALPGCVSPEHAGPVWTLVVDDRRPEMPESATTVRLVPRTIVVGLGARREVTRTAVTETVALLDTEHGLDPRAVRACATVDGKATEPALVEAVQDLGFWNSPDGDELPLLSFPPGTLDAVPVPNPSEVVRSESGSGGVAEAAALHAAGTMGAAELAVPKTKGSGVTVAAARVLPRGRLAVIGIGPGEHEQRTPRADTELRRSSIVVGVDSDVNRVRHLLRPGTGIVTSGAADALDRALERARAGNAVALIGSVGSGVTEIATGALDRIGDAIEIVVVPGAGQVRGLPG